jgi:hypothetical protein
VNKEELWKIYCDKNPQFSDEDSVFRMTGRGLKKLFDQTFDIAHDKGFANGKAKAEMEQNFKSDIGKKMGFPW